MDFLTRSARPLLLALLALATCACTEDSLEHQPWSLQEEVERPEEMPPEPDDPRPEPTPMCMNNCLPGDPGVPVEPKVPIEPEQPELVTATGWFSTEFEHVGFTPLEGLLGPHFETPENLNACAHESLYPRESYPGESDQPWWWVQQDDTAIPSLQLFPNVHDSVHANRAGLVHLTGQLSPEGSYGHSDAYQHQITPIEASLDVCGTFEKLGHCAVPRAGDVCITPQLHHAPKEHQSLNTSLEYRPPAETVVGALGSYALKVTVDDGFPDSRTDLVFTFPEYVRDLDGLPRQTTMRLIEDLEGASLHVTEYGVAVNEELYPNDALRGWVSHYPDQDGQTHFRISLSLARGSNIHVWGDFILPTDVDQ